MIRSEHIPVSTEIGPQEFFEHGPPPTAENEQVKAFDVGSPELHEALRSGQLELHDAAQQPVSLALSELEPLNIYENGTQLLGVMDIGGVEVSILNHKDEVAGKDFLFLASNMYDPSEEATDNALPVNKIPVLISEGKALNLGRGNSAIAARLGFNEHVSREHLSVSVEDGVLSVVDLNSTNGTSIITQPKAETLAAPKNLERKIGNETHVLKGALALESRGNPLVFESTDETGKRVNYFVYTSNSEGGLRVSQGIEKEGSRFMKGPELSRFAQYTQDTQLHPDFEEFYTEVKEATAAGVQMIDPEDLLFDEATTDAMLKDFESEVQVYGTGYAELDGMLRKVKAGMLSSGDLQAAFQTNEAGIPAALDTYVTSLNSKLEESGIMPNFESRPKSSTVREHPILGSFTTDVYESQMPNGVVLEWHMAEDTQGRVWVDRIRLEDSTPTAHGTDAQMLYSGILTSKPIDYDNQTNGLSPEEAQKISGSYTDISGFLAELAPIKQYKQRGKPLAADSI